MDNGYKPLPHDYQKPVPRSFEIKEVEGGRFIEARFPGLVACTLTENDMVRTFRGPMETVMRPHPDGAQFPPELLHQVMLREYKEPYRANTKKRYPTLEIYYPATMNTIENHRKWVESFGCRLLLRG